MKYLLSTHHNNSIQRIKTKCTFRAIILTICLLGGASAFAESIKKEPHQVKMKLNEDGTHYIKFTGLAQQWLRYTDMNPGSELFGNPFDAYTDMGIRRLRFSVFGQINDYLFFCTQFGMNNFTFRSTQYDGAFFHDALGEVVVAKKKLNIGAGLTSWAGLSRYSAPSAGKILSLDAPLYQQATNGINDQFIRRFTIYGKGQIKKIDYRVGVSFPFAIQVAPSNLPPMTFLNATFSHLPPKPQVNGYIKYQFFEEENNTTPFGVGTYLEKKKLLAIGVGYTIQEAAISELNVTGDTLFKPLVLLAGDVFFNIPLNPEKGTSLTWYGAYQYSDYGKNFLLNGAVMNPANGVGGLASLNGSGNGFPIRGTGDTFYSQFGFAFGNKIISKQGKLQPFVACQYSDFQALDEAMIMTEGGLNWFITGDHSTKLSINYQNRPIFVRDQNFKAVVSHYRGMAQIQLQASF